MVSDFSKIEVFDETRLGALEKKLGISIKNRELLKSAITSPKARENITLDELEDLDRLAFIGDSILYFVTSEHVLKKYNDVNEKKNLHDEREKYKQDKNLAQILLKNQLLEYFRIEENYLCGSIKWTEMMGTFFEAIIGALYLDQCNLDSARCFVKNYIIPNIDRIIDEGSCMGKTNT